MAGIELKQQLKQVQTLVLTPQLQLAIKLLQLPRLELIEQIRQELESNPVMDDVQGTSEDEDLRQSFEGTGPAASAGREERGEGPRSETEVKGAREVDWERYMENAALAPVIPVYRRAPDEELPGVEAAPSKSETLYDHLMWQIRLSDFPPRERQLAELIVENLDEYGYFRDEPLSARAAAPPPAEVEPREQEAAREPDGAAGEAPAAQAGEGEQPPPGAAAEERESPPPAQETFPLADSQNPQVTLELLCARCRMTAEEGEAVLRTIQRLDPVGIAARSLEECLLVQAELMGLDRVVCEVIRLHLRNLQKRNYAAVARDLKISIAEVAEAARKIALLDPRPARNFVGDPPQYVVPDVYVERSGDGFEVKVNDDGMPKLRISDAYRRAMSDPRARDYIKEKLNNARLLIRSIEQRRKTIIRVTECIVEKQRDFMERGTAGLKPMVLRDVARALDLHESTISRVTSGKYVHTPQGIFELKYFFNSGVHNPNGEDTSSEVVKNTLKEIVAGEDGAAPLSDQQIVEVLSRRHGIAIARRTVTKYRECLGILPSGQRRDVPVR